VPGEYREKAHYIPHGVDTEFWDPGLAAAAGGQGISGLPAVNGVEKNMALCVGSHGLDRDVLTKLIRANPLYSWSIVGLKRQLEGLPDVTYLRGISDEQLRDLYATACIMVRPLTFATANNSVLEAMAMDKTIVASRIPGITDYLNDSNCIFVDTIKDLSLENVQSRLPDAGVVRGYAVREFSWRTVFNAYVNLYNQK
jgi:glycosyltransferase involved in cell wall biosynthesis